MGWSRSFVTNQVTLVTRSTTHLLFGRSCRTHSRKSILLTCSYKGSKSWVFDTRNGCSNTRLLFADGLWYCRAPVSVFRRINPNAKFTLNTIGWSAKIRLSCSWRLAGLMVAKRKLYQSCKRFPLLNRVRIWGQCWRYIWAMVSSELGTKSKGIKTGSACQLELAADGCDVELVLARSVLLDFFAGEAYLVLAAERFRVETAAGCWCAVRIWAL